MKTVEEWRQHWCSSMNGYSLLELIRDVQSEALAHAREECAAEIDRLKVELNVSRGDLAHLAKYTRDRIQAEAAAIRESLTQATPPSESTESPLDKAAGCRQDGRGTQQHRGDDMATKLTVRELWNLLPHGLHTRVLYQDLSRQDQDRIDRWYVYFDARAKRETAAEIAQLKSQIAELERPATTTPPKPRKTAGQKLCDVLFEICQSFRWADYDDKNKERMQSAAIKLGLIDDPEPKTDGELLCEAYNAKVMLPLMAADFWKHTADEFLARRAERDWETHTAEFRRERAERAERDGV